MKKRVTAILLTLIFVLNVFTIIPVVSASAETDSTHLHTWDEPTWEWNVDENGASATAVFTCSTCGETLRKPADSVDLESGITDCHYSSKTYYACVALSDEEGSGSYSDYHTVDLEPHHTQLRHLDFTVPTPEQNGSIDCWYCDACHTYLEEEGGEYHEIPEEKCILPYLRYELDGSDAKVVQYLGKDNKVTVPEFVPATYPETYLRDKRVTSIELMPYDYFNENTDSTFHSAIYLKEIDCPTIERIEDNAFEGEYMLEKVSTGSSLNYIGSRAFPPESIKEFSSDSEQITIADDAFEGYGGYGYSNSAVLIGKHTSGLCEVADKYDYLTFKASDSHIYTDEPTWEWNVDENGASATAVFTCSTCGETLRKPADSVDLETEFIDCLFPSKTYYASVALSSEEGSGSYSDYHTVDLEPHHTQLRHLDFTVPTPEQNGSIDCWYCDACHTYLKEEGGEYHEIPEEECILPYLRYEANGSGAKVVQYLGNDNKVTVPEFVPATYPETYLRGKRVTSIELMPYSYMEFHSAIYLKEIDCPTIERIEDNAFEGEYMLEKVSTGSALNYIGSRAFPPESIKEFSSDSEQITIADDAFEGYGGYGYSNNAVLIGKHTSGLCEVADKYDYLTFKASDSHIYTDEPTWEWNGFDSAEASFGCTAHDHTETITAEITSEVTTPATLDHEGVRTYTATVSFNDKTYRDAKTESIPVSAEVKHSLTVDEAKIGVNFYIPDGAVISDSAEIVTKVIDGVSYNRVQLRVPAAEMTKELTVTYTVNGEEKTDTYSVIQYADTILNSSYPEDLKDLIKAMLNYGAQAQLEFERSTDKLANDGIDYAPAPINVEDINFNIPNKDAINSNLVPACNISYYGFSLLLQSDTALRFYFKKEAADIATDEIHITVNNEPVEVMDYNSRYVYIEIKNILADKLDTPYALTVNDVAIGTYSALSYIKDTLMNYSDDEQLCNTVSSLYDYHLKAKSYFG